MKILEIKEQRCCICKKLFVGLGNNPSPVKKKGRCCDDCNLQVVIKKRLGVY